MNEIYKKCRTCQETKEITLFSLDHGARTPDCKKCRYEKYGEITKKKRKENPELYRQKEREKYAQNKEKERERKRNWAKNNPEKVASIKKRCREKDSCKEKERQTALLYRQKNRDKCNKYAREYRKRRIQTDPYFELTDRIKHSIRRILEKKNSRSLLYTGCDSVGEFYEKLSQKTENKNWLMDGYALDHIFQINWFSNILSSPDSQDYLEDFMKILHHHSNLRPIEKVQNSKRSNIDIVSVDLSLLENFWDFLDERIKVLFLSTTEIEKNLSKPMILRGSKLERRLMEICQSTTQTYASSKQHSTCHNSESESSLLPS